jgi:hypothetical protein
VVRMSGKDQHFANRRRGTLAGPPPYLWGERVGAIAGDALEGTLRYWHPARPVQAAHGTLRLARAQGPPLRQAPSLQLVQRRPPSDIQAALRASAASNVAN